MAYTRQRKQNFRLQMQFRRNLMLVGIKTKGWNRSVGTKCALTQIHIAFLRNVL
jgi:hypothetical protein